jgi:hypothetical protein
VKYKTQNGWTKATILQRLRGKDRRPDLREENVEDAP